MQILHGDCLDLFKEIDAGSVSAVMTSPPYKTRDNFSYKMIAAAAKEIHAVLKPGGLAFINFGQLSEEPMRPYRVAACFADYLTLGPVISWIKSMPELGGHFTPFGGSNWLNRKWEPIFIFSKGPSRALDRYAEGLAVEYKWAGNKKRWKHNRSVQCKGDVWYYPYETVGNQFGKMKRTHPHQLPAKLCASMVKLAGLGEGDLVIDPFAGSGAVGYACRDQGVKFLGFDNNEAYCGELGC